MRLQLDSKQKNQDPTIREDFARIEKVINGQQRILEVDAYATDPTGFGTTNGKVFIWYNTTTNELQVHINGVTRSIATV